MLETLLGIAGGLVSNAITNSESEAREEEARKEREKQAQQALVSYHYQLGKNAAAMQAGINQTSENTAQQMDYINSADAIMGGNGAKAAQMRNSALQQQTQLDRATFQDRLKADATAAQQRDVILNDVSKQKVADLQQQADTIKNSNPASTFFGMAADDLTSHLETGKGVLETAFEKKKIANANNASQGIKVGDNPFGIKTNAFSLG